MSRKILYGLLLTVGLGVGVMFALPIPDIAGKCPPEREGLVQCAINRQVLPTIMRILIGVIATFLTYEMLTGLPTLYRRWRAGEFKKVVGENPPWQEDPLLVASVWGETYDDARAAKGGVHNSRLARKLNARRFAEDAPVGTIAHYARQAAPEPTPAPEPEPAPVRPDPERVAAIAMALDSLEKLAGRR